MDGHLVRRYFNLGLRLLESNTQLEKAHITETATS